MVFFRDHPHPIACQDTYIQAPSQISLMHGSIEGAGPHRCFRTWANGACLIRHWATENGRSNVPLGGHPGVMEAVERDLHVRRCRRLSHRLVATTFLLGVLGG